MGVHASERYHRDKPLLAEASESCGSSSHPRLDRSHTPPPQTVSCVLPLEDHPHHWGPSAHDVQLGSKRLRVSRSRCGVCKMFAEAGLHCQFARPSQASEVDTRKFQEQAPSMRKGPGQQESHAEQPGPGRMHISCPTGRV